MTRQLRSDPLLRSEVEAARAWGVRPSELAQWPDHDRDLAVAWVEYDHDTCSGCGHPLSETTDPQNTFAYQAEPIRCHACAAAERGTKDVDDTAGLRVRVVRRD